MLKPSTGTGNSGVGRWKWPWSRRPRLPPGEQSRGLWRPRAAARRLAVSPAEEARSSATPCRHAQHHLQHIKCGEGGPELSHRLSWPLPSAVRWACSSSRQGPCLLTLLKLIPSHPPALAHVLLRPLEASSPLRVKLIGPWAGGVNAASALG